MSEKSSINKDHTVRVGGDCIESLEVNLIYVLSQSIDQFVKDVESRLNAKDRMMKQRTKMLFNRLTDAARRVAITPEALDCDIAILSCKRTANGPEYDDWHAEANALCRLLLLYEDRCRTKEQADSVFDTMEKNPEGLVTESVLKRFTLK